MFAAMFAFFQSIVEGGGVYVRKDPSTQIIIDGQPMVPFTGTGQVSGPDMQDPHGLKQRMVDRVEVSEPPPPGINRTQSSLPDRLRVKNALARMERKARFCKVLRVVPPKFKPFIGRNSSLGGKPAHLHATVKEVNAGEFAFSSLVDGSSMDGGAESVEGMVEGPSKLVLAIRKVPRKEEPVDEDVTQKKRFHGRPNKLGGRSEVELRSLCSETSFQKGRFFFRWENFFSGVQSTAIVRGLGMAVQFYPALTVVEEEPSLPTTTRIGRVVREPKAYDPSILSAPVAELEENKVLAIVSRQGNGKFRVTMDLTEEEMRESESGLALLKKFYSFGLKD
jgi:hypothetical protein